MSAFASSRLGTAAGTTLKDTGSLIHTLGDGTTGTTKAGLDKLEDDVENLTDLGKKVAEAVKKQTDLIAKMAQLASAEVAVEPFTVASAGRVTTLVATALIALDEAVDIIAVQVSKGDGDVEDPAISGPIRNIFEPWVAPFRSLGGNVAQGFDSMVSSVLGVQDASSGMAERLSAFRDDGGRFELRYQLSTTDKKTFEPGGVLTLQATRLDVFLAYGRVMVAGPTEAEKAELVERDEKWWRPDEAVLGLRLTTTVEPGLTSDPLLKQIMPGSKPPADSQPTTLTLDSRDGLYLGDGRGNEKAVLPIRYDLPAVELREVALSLLRNATREVTGLELTLVVAGKIGSIVGVLVEGVGATIGLDGEPTANAMFPMAVSPRLLDGAGIRVDAGIVKGGGYLRRKGSEYGGVLQLQIGRFGVYAIGLITTDEFSMVLVMGISFSPAIELSFGFTLNGVGGLLAINRTVNTAEMRKGMREHIIDNLLFPDDPITAAPKILDQLGAVFPRRQGGFVVGPIFEIGWGSQARIVEAKLGVALSLPEPTVLILGSLRVRAPAKDLPITDLRCEVYAEITSEHFLLFATLADSKIAGLAISGDLGLLIGWGKGVFALSVGGFHPSYTEAPAELADLRRLAIDLSPPKQKILKIKIEAYFAITAGAVMLGVKGELKADVGVASVRAWLIFDAIFRWSPVFGFEISLELGLEVRVFGTSFASISFRGMLAGTRPWMVRGTAKIDVWFLPTVDIDLGPIEWGDRPTITATADPLGTTTQALQAPDAWKAELPAGCSALVRLVAEPQVVVAEGEAPPLLAHPLAALEVSQVAVPLETHIDRIGTAAVSAHRVHLGVPTTDVLDGGAASTIVVGAVSTTKAPFAPGQFLALSGEEMLDRAGFEPMPSGCRMSPAPVPLTTAKTVQEDVVWHTYYRDADPAVDGRIESFHLSSFATVLGHGLVGRHQVDTDNAYLPRAVAAALAPGAGTTIEVQPATAVQLSRTDDGTVVLDTLGALSQTEARRVAAVLSAAGAAQLTPITVGVTA